MQQIKMPVASHDIRGPLQCALYASYNVGHLSNTMAARDQYFFPVYINKMHCYMLGNNRHDINNMIVHVSDAIT